jgi:hypothetical protein
MIYSSEIYERQKSVIVGSMLFQFWRIIEENRYYPDPILKKEVLTIMITTTIIMKNILSKRKL